MPSLTRRHFLTTSATALAAATLAPHLLAAPPPLPRFPVGVCDWMILKRQKLGAFSRTAEIGADGVEVDMGGLGDRPTFDNKLLGPSRRDQFLATADELGLRISSIAMSGFYAQSFAEPHGIDRVVADIDSIVRQVRFPGWQRTEAGEREVKKALRRSLLKYKLHTDQDLFDRAYAYIHENY